MGKWKRRKDSDQEALVRGSHALCATGPLPVPVAAVLQHVFMKERKALDVEPQNAEANEDYARVQKVSFPSEELPPLPFQPTALSNTAESPLLSGRLAGTVPTKVVWPVGLR